MAPSLWRLRLWGAFAWVPPLYWLAVFPQARRELRAWERRAGRIPDPCLRDHALLKLRTEGMTAEGAAAFAILATPRSYRHTVRACIAFELIYDYIDALAEEPVANVLANNRVLYGALVAAVSPSAPLADWYALHPCHDDGGYLQALVETCRDALLRLPEHELVLDGLRRLATRANDAQSLHHAASGAEGERALARWAGTQQPPGCALDWWELAAAAGSPLGCFALIGSAAHRNAEPAAAAAVERAYFPWIAALSWLLESLVDQDEDAPSGAHSFVAHYDPPQTAARRLGTIAEHAVHDARLLPRGARHTLLLAGMVAMYLSDAGASSCAARGAAEAVRAAVGGPVVPFLWMLRLRRRLTRRETATARSGRSASRAARRRWRPPWSPRRAGRRR